MNQLNKIKHLLLAFVATTFLFYGSVHAQSTAGSSCDTCTVPWGPITQKIYDSVTVRGLDSDCLFTVYLDIQTRNCYGSTQIRLVNQSIVSQCDTCGCLLSCYNVGPIMERISKLLLVEYGGHITLSKPSACYYLLEYDLSPSLTACLGPEAASSPHWYAVLPCDDTGCCVTEYLLRADGRVQTLKSVSVPCNRPAPSPIPPTITVYCWSMGVRNAYVVNVVPPTTPLTCEIACSTTGYVFSKTTDIDEKSIVTEPIVYPNPATDEINISKEIQWYRMLIVDMQGRTIQEHRNSGKAINVRGLAAGTYMILLDNQNGQRQKQLLIKE